MSIYNFDCYKQLILHKISELPSNGRGQLAKLAKYINVHPSFLSQTLKGEKDLSLEQALDAASFFGFSGNEKTYFIKLIEWQRAGTKRLKDYFDYELKKLRSKAKEAETRVVNKKKLSDHDQAVFYSHYLYSAIRLSCSIPNISRDKLVKLFDYPIEKIFEVLDFLLEREFIKEIDGKLKLGVTNTHLGNTSSLIINHHRNWRLKAMERHPKMEESEFAFSAPMGISIDDAQQVKEEILSIIEKISKRVNKSPSEQVCILNIDFLKLY